MGVAGRLRCLDAAHKDALLAGALTLLAQTEVWLSPATRGIRLETALAAGAVTLALAFRRRAPLATSLVLSTAVAGLSMVAGLPNAVFLMPVAVLATYSLGAYAAAEKAVAGLTVVLVAVPIGAMRMHDAALTDFTAPVVLFTAAWASGRMMRKRRERDALLEQQHRELVRHQDQREERAAEGERRRIARELHDIVAHRVTTIVIQAESGTATADDPEQARRTFATIARTGRESLEELRRLLGLLHDPDHPRSMSPAPGLDQLDALVADVRLAGLDVMMRMEGTADALPAGAGLAAYRIVQESLTNALRHGCGRAEVVVRRTVDELVLDVRNPVAGEVSTSSRTNGAGRGLAGMRERVRVYDGTVQAHQEDSEWVVHAVLLLQEPDR